nr:RNA-directed DNA polymerase, eukaryota [Tanacetum cinerariifolium]
LSSWIPYDLVCDGNDNHFGSVERYDSGRAIYGLRYGRVYEGHWTHHWDTRSRRRSQMYILSLNIQGLGHKTKKEWVKELNIKHKVNFLALQETNMDRVNHMDVKFIRESTVASELGSSSVDASFRRSVRDGVERQQWDDLNSVSGSVTLSTSKDRWICDLNGDGVFRVKEVRTILDDIFLPSAADDTR